MVQVHFPQEKELADLFCFMPLKSKHSPFDEEDAQLNRQHQEGQQVHHQVHWKEPDSIMAVPACLTQH